MPAGSDARILVWDAQEVAGRELVKLEAVLTLPGEAAEGAQRVQELSARAAMEPRHGPLLSLKQLNQREFFELFGVFFKNVFSTFSQRRRILLGHRRLLRKPRRLFLMHFCSDMHELFEIICA